MQATTSKWRIGGEVINITRDPIEHVSINEDCHPLNEKNCDVQKALTTYLSLTVNEETKALFEALRCSCQVILFANNSLEESFF